MFDIGFSELAVIGVVALVVLGPERLPRAARTAGHLLSRFQRYVSQVKSDINREMDLANLKKIQAEVESAAKDIQSTVSTSMIEAQKEVESAGGEIKKAGEQIQQAASGVNLMAGWPGAGGATASAPADSAPAEPSQSQLELGLDTPSAGEGRRA
ncbi:MAG: twin-arginine translocase subunit TatB [Betaproteobacteria bacterium]|nr:twin-arginine translocase subunit TatB [Betaproteobacteria bacterium]